MKGLLSKLKSPRGEKKSRGGDKPSGSPRENQADAKKKEKPKNVKNWFRKHVGGAGGAAKLQHNIITSLKKALKEESATNRVLTYNGRLSERVFALADESAVNGCVPQYINGLKVLYFDSQYFGSTLKEDFPGAVLLAQRLLLLLPSITEEDSKRDIVSLTGIVLANISLIDSNTCQTVFARMSSANPVYFQRYKQWLHDALSKRDRQAHLAALSVTGYYQIFTQYVAVSELLPSTKPVNLYSFFVKNIRTEDPATLKIIFEDVLKGGVGVKPRDFIKSVITGPFSLFVKTLTDYEETVRRFNEEEETLLAAIESLHDLYVSRGFPYSKQSAQGIAGFIQRAFQDETVEQRLVAALAENARLKQHVSVEKDATILELQCRVEELEAQRARDEAVIRELQWHDLATRGEEEEEEYGDEEDPYEESIDVDKISAILLQYRE